MEPLGTTHPLARISAVVSGVGFEEFGPKLNIALSEAAEQALNELLDQAAIAGAIRAKLVVHRAFSGSWVVDATLNLWTGVAFAYVTLETVSKAPKIVEGLTAIEGRIKALFARKVESLTPGATFDLTTTIVPPAVTTPLVSTATPNNWTARLQQFVGTARVYLRLRGCNTVLSGTVTSVDSDFVYLTSDREYTFALLSELVAVEVARDA